MAKKLINLLIEPETDTKTVKLLKKYTPAASIILLILFFFSYVFSLIYVNIKLKAYNRVQKDTTALEGKIAKAKSEESIYITTIRVLDKITNILAKDTKLIDNSLPVIFGYRNSDVSVDIITVDNKGPVTFTVKSASIDAMNNFIDELKKSEDEYSFRDIRAASILRENDGSYTLNINLTATAQKNGNI